MQGKMSMGRINQIRIIKFILTVIILNWASKVILTKRWKTVTVAMGQDKSKSR